MSEQSAGTILIIDDSVITRHVLAVTLRQAGFVLAEAGTGVEGLRLAQALRPDLITLDIKLPDIDGFEVCQRLREDPATAAIPILQISATFTATQDRTQALDMGADAFLAQPVEPLELVATVRALLRARRAEAELKELADIVASSEDAIIGLQPDGVIASWNPGATRLYGYTREQALGMHVATLAPADRQQELVVLLARIGAGESVTSHETRRVRQDGVAIDVSTTLSPIQAEGRIKGISAIDRDISERCRLEEQLFQARKMESLGILAGGVAHDFNNLLTAVLGHAGILQGKAVEGSLQHTSAVQIEKAALRMAELAKQMLAYSGKGHFIMQPLNLDQLVREMAHRLQASLPAGVALRLELAAARPIQADSGQLWQAVLNLVINAGEAIGDGTGTITVSTGSLNAGNGGGAVRALPADTCAYVEVADTGGGIAAEYHEKVFDPFFSTKFTGRGLGLAVVQGIVRGHRGLIEIESTEGAGSTFRLVFPAAAAANQPAAGPPRPAAAPGETILVVDDEAPVRNIARLTLEQAGYRVLLAADGQEGVAVFRVHADQIAAVLLDLTMPVMSGEATFAEIRCLQPDARVILSSGYTEEDATNQFIGLGLAGFLQKPYQLPTLLARIAEVCADKG